VSLADRLKARVRADGPMSIADYMTACLFDPAEGYYSTREPFGTQGDFTTAPEISQMFGELIGLCLAQVWLDQGAPQPFCLAEFGPGRGTLMADLLRATAKVPGFHQGMRLHLAEASPRLRQVQTERLAGFDITFIERAEDLPEIPLFLVANEFFDALPIRQFVRQGAHWAERVIGLQGDALAFGLSPPAPLPALERRLTDTKDGDLVELCPAALFWLLPVAERIGHQGGAALIIDYGAGPSVGDTFQALSKHKPVDPLEQPGHADLTAHVDFAALADIARADLVVASLTPQGALLNSLGIAVRAAKLAESLSGARLADHQAALHRLTSPSEMGTLFKTLALTPKGQRLPPGFPS
jgi:NADH dehydrogenase [ubiquinone] 1 alpha subcomplex assembly factor 7